MKIIGCIFIVISSIYSSYLYEKHLKKKIQDAGELYELIIHIKSQIEYFAKPIKDIFNEYNTENEAIKDVLTNKENSNLSFLEGNTREASLSLLSELGKGYKKEQISLCEYTASSLLEYRRSLISDYSRRVRVSRSICLFMGACTIILLV